MPIKKQIGTYHVKDGETRTKNFEVAAWYQELKVDPGDYPVYALFEEKEGEGSGYFDNVAVFPAL